MTYFIEPATYIYILCFTIIAIFHYIISSINKQGDLVQFVFQVLTNVDKIRHRLNLRIWKTATRMTALSCGDKRWVD